MDRVVPADDDCRLWTAQSGHGPPLVFCHGGPGLWDYFDTVADALRDRARTVRWDQRGCGRSDRRGPYTVARSIADLDAIRRDLGASRIGLLGHSWGATLALRYTLEHPDQVSRLIYVSGTGIDPDQTWKPAYQRNLNQRIGVHTARWRELRDRDRTPAEDRDFAVLQWSADFADPATARQHAEHMATPWLGIAHECADSLKTEVRQYSQDRDLPAMCRTLNVPTLIVDGDQDVRPRSAVDSLQRALPNVERVTFAGAGHLPWIEQPDAFHQIVADFLGRHGRAPASLR